MRPNLPNQLTDMLLINLDLQVWWTWESDKRHLEREAGGLLAKKCAKKKKILANIIPPKITGSCCFNVKSDDDGDPDFQE